MNESEFFYVDDPTVAILPGGGSAVAWVDNRRQDVLFQVFDASGQRRLPTPVNVSRTPNVFSWLPRLAADGRHVYVLWQEIVFSGGSHGGEAFFARSLDGGAHFEEPINLSQSRAGDGKGRLTKDRWHNGSLALAVSPRGTVLAAWTAYEGALHFVRSTDGGASFEPTRQIAGSRARPARGPTLAAASDERIFVAWTVGETPNADIHFAVSEDGGRTFGDARVVSRTAGHSDAPSLVTDSRGTVHLAFGERTSGPWGRSHVRYARADRNSLTFSRGMVLSTTLGPDEAAGFPSLAIDGDDRLFVVWEHYPDFRERPRGLGFALSVDRGASFSAPTLVPGTTDPSLGFNGSLQGLLTNKLASSGGAVSIVNSTFQSEQHSLVRLVRGRVQ